MKHRLSRLAFKAFRWWREMVCDLLETDKKVDTVAQKLHRVAGRVHVMEVEAYGDTKPRHTRIP